MKSFLLMVVGTLPLLASCAATHTAARLKEVQDSQGFYTKSLYYCGSDPLFHYFEQDVMFDRPFWIPGAKLGGIDACRVRRHELELPADLFFSRSTYEGDHDRRRTKVRISDGPPFRVERRTYRPRKPGDWQVWLEKHVKLQ